MMTPREHLGIGAAPLALEELLLDMVLGNEAFNRFAQDVGHRHRLNEIGACLREGFPFRGIDRDGCDCIGPGALRRAQYDPDVWGARCEVVAIA